MHTLENDRAKRGSLSNLKALDPRLSSDALK